jgi:hypothetical protein
MSTTVKPVDENGLEIRNLKIWRQKNPGKIQFDSKFEWGCWRRLSKLGIPFQFQPDPIQVMNSFATLGFSKNDIKPIKVKPMVYTPDFLIEVGPTKYYIECKGYFRQRDQYRFKFCQYILHTQNLGHILLVKTDLEFDRVVNLITNKRNNKSSL